jgi:hypothetical protein
MNSSSSRVLMAQAVNRWQKADGTLNLKGAKLKDRVEGVLKDGARDMTYDEIRVELLNSYPTDYSASSKDAGTIKFVDTIDVQFMAGLLVREDKVIDQ